MGLTLLAFVLFGVFFAAVGGLVLWMRLHSRAAELAKAMRAVPRTAVSAVRAGTMVKLVGRVRLVGEPLAAPLTGQACAYFHVRVERRALGEEDDSFGRPTLSKSWVPLHDDVERRPFLLEDDTGTALVKLDMPEVLIQRASTNTSGILQPPPEQLVQYLQDHGLQEWKARTLRCEERILAEGDEVAVLGWATLEATDGAVGEPVTRVVVSDTPEAAVRVATTDALGA